MSEIISDKGWHLRVSDGVTMTFSPVFVINKMKDGETKIATDKDVECTMVRVKMEKGGKQDWEFDIPFQEFFMFVYYCCNEEKRQEMQLRLLRTVTEIPYEVTFKLDSGEIQAKMAKRLIKVPVDEITMAIVRSEAQLLSGKANLENINDWFRKRTIVRKGRNKLLENK